MFVRILDPAIVFVLEFVIFAIRIWIPPVPKRLNELFPLFLVRELHERLALFVADDPAHILVQPLLIRVAKLVLERFRILFPSLFPDRPFERISRLIFRLVHLGLAALSLVTCR